MTATDYLQIAGSVWRFGTNIAHNCRLYVFLYQCQTVVKDIYINLGTINGARRIIASFDGSKSYWPSAAETPIGVSAGQSSAQQFSWQESTEIPIITTEVAIIAAIAFAAVIGVAAYVVLRKRQ